MSTIETDLAPAPVVTPSASPAREPGQSRRRTRPRSQYWDVATATWRTAGPIPDPRRGD